jgi:hypothetical protein
MFRKAFSGIGTLLATPVGVIITTNVVWLIVMWLMDIPRNTIIYYVVSFIIFVLDVFVAFTLRDRLIHFFSQFVLPIQNPKDRRDIALRVSNFETGNRGPALFVKNGRVILHEGEAGRRGAGLIMLDTASALVLRTDTEIKETIGPGIKFTKADEYIAGSVDLRAQWHVIGPLSTDQPSFNPLLISAPKDYDETQSRRQTIGLTRDGFEVSPTISIKFSVKRPVERQPTDSGVTSYYGFDPAAVRNAITRKVIQLGTSENSKVSMEWNELPEHLIVNIWREYIRKFKLGDLFIAFDDNGDSGLQIIEKMINNRVKQPSVRELDDTGSQTGAWVESLEFKQLKSRGLEIMETRIHNILFDPDMEKQIIQQWSADWMTNAQKEASYLREKEALIETAAREDASKAFARIASQPFRGKTTQSLQNQFTTLQLLIDPLKKYILIESAANNEMEMELRKLDEIWKWLLDNNINTLPSDGKSGAQQ